MASIKDLEKAASATNVPVCQGVVCGEEILERQDVEDAISLLKKCKTLLCYMADRDLLRAVSMKERDAMNRCVEKIDIFLDDVESHYEEVDEEEF